MPGDLGTLDFGCRTFATVNTIGAVDIAKFPDWKPTVQLHERFPGLNC